MLFIYGVGLPNHDLHQLKRALLDEVAQLAKGGVTAAELSKAKNQLATGFLARMRRISGVAHQIGQSTYVRGDPKAFLGDVAALDAVTVDDVKRVASRYLKEQNLNLVLLPASGQSQGRQP